MVKKAKPKLSPFGLPSFKNEERELRESAKQFYKNLPEHLRKKIEEIKRQQKNK